ncbi:HlyD family efflux transporter periplasmic adaptor subunit [Noviherbaspirillum aerium]|uniref:HlyD family efflux transporter periplasmic adaptor subunit n=1 Tax=Noviherbaspirillum aerium TaxID=2588497 RepID=UPI00124D4AC0|nr:HlyD family efflux transporter periplasmic adaptor subunit [Noviherbaspirillum aerium]
MTATNVADASHASNALVFPPLREELGLHAGPLLTDGQPSWTLEDPVRNQFFRIDWLTFEVLKRWSFANASDILQDIHTDTTLQPGEEDLAHVLRFLADNQLLRPDARTSAHQFAARHAKLRGSWHQQLLHHYLFFRIPLVRPDRWLDRIAPSMNWVFSPMFARLTLLALLLGGVQVYREWDRFSMTLLDTFTPTGILAYALALAGVKCAHELGHALTAKRYGCRVPAMGLAFLVLWPVPYTDTNDVWRLNDKRARQRVAAAGVKTELVIAIWATLAWVMLPDGLLRSIAFPLATTTWLATLAINTSPFMRFDGYFLLSDWLDLPNLHARAFALARWDLRRRLFGLDEPPPEYVSRRRHAGLILFAWATWIYRLTLFIGIAALVYHFFIKLVGIVLFAVEIIWFVLRPIANELAAWRALWPQLKDRRRAYRSALLLIALLLLFVLPWPTRLQATGVLRASQVFPVHAPAHAQVAALPPAEGSEVKAGQVLLQLSGAENASRHEELAARIERLRWQSQAAGFDAEQRARIMVLREELATAEAELAALKEDAARYQPVAPFDGLLRDIEPDLKPGVWVGKNEKLAVLVGKNGSEVDAYLEEHQVRRVAVGDAARFYPDGLEGPFVQLQVIAIDRDAAQVLPSGVWAAQQGGMIAAREKQGQWIPEHAVYHVTLAVREGTGTLAGQSWRGKVVIAGDWEAPGMQFVQSFAALLWREMGF